MVFNWIFNNVSLIINPITNFIVRNSNFKELLASSIILTVIVLACFLVGLFERTKLGHMFFGYLDKYLLVRLPGYTIVKETIVQFVGSKESPFSRVALVRPFGNETKQTAFVTDEHIDGSYTVFVPTGPNPTSGNIFHLRRENVELLDHSIESTMRSIISCGAGSKGLLVKSKL